MVPERFKQLYFKQGYRIVGQHSACKVCHWTKASLRGKGVCYKQEWYGIESHRCLQCTPALFFCTQRCNFCWRSIEATVGASMEGLRLDEPSCIVEGLIVAQRQLLSGFGSCVERQKFLEAMNPKHAAISLAGEPTLYPRLGELLQEFHRKGFTTFLVTNGTVPEKLASLETEPTQLYITLAAPNEAVYRKLCMPIISKAWQMVQQSLELMHSFACRKVIRLTLVKGWNLRDPKSYAKMIARAECDCVEVKAYMWVGESRHRLGRGCMPSIEEVREFARQLSEHLGYSIKAESLPSRVVLLSRT